MREIDRLARHADSINTYWAGEHARTQERSRVREDSLTAQRDRARKELDSANRARDRGSALSNQLRRDSTASDSNRTLIRRDTERLVEISSLRSRIYVDSLRILNITADRDDWKAIADSLLKANTAINNDIKKIQRVVGHKIDLGFITIPSEVVAGTLALSGGFLLGRVTKSDSSD